MADQNQNEGPLITLPDDEVLQRQLREKLEEYKGRMKPFRAPELQMNTICKITVLERLLAEGRVSSYQLSREMAAAYDGSFDGYAFEDACGVIEDYCKNGGRNLHGGTGLPDPK